MTLARFCDWFLLGALAAMAVLGLGRAAVMHSRGVRVVVIPKKLKWWQVGGSLAGQLATLLWGYELVAYAWPLSFHCAPETWGAVLIEQPLVKMVGVLAVGSGVIIYGLALRDLGSAWRLGLDEASPGPLKTRGVFSWSRNPIYVALDLFVIGSFLIVGRSMFLVFAGLAVIVFHVVIRFEEQHLRRLFGPTYEQYCRRVGRYGGRKGD